MLELVNKEGEHVLEADEFKITIAGSLPSERSKELGAADWIEAVLNVN